MTYFNLSNFLTLLRGPLAFLFMIDSVFYRTLAVVLAMITDSLDGYLARRSNTTSQLGAFLDPLMDKFFVFFVLGIFLYERQLDIGQVLALISRDFALLIFGCYLLYRGMWDKIHFQAIWTGKIATTLQFFILSALIFHFTIPGFIFNGFILLGVLALIELYYTENKITRSLNKN